MPGLQSPTDVCAWYIHDTQDTSHILCPECVARFIGTATVYPLTRNVLGPARLCSGCDTRLTTPTTSLVSPFPPLPPADTARDAESGT